MIILAVIASSAGSILEHSFGMNYYVGVTWMMAATGILVFMGGKTLEFVFSYWSFFLYAIFILFVAFSFTSFGDKIMTNLLSAEVKGGWLVGGFQYALYNMGVIPVVLFATKYIENRKEAYIAGGLAGLIGIIPALFIYLALVGQYPGVLSEAVPTNYILGVLGSTPFQLAFQIMLFGTLIETSTGCIHAVNNRIQSVFSQKQKTMPAWVRPAVAIGLLTAGAAIAQFGLIGLIAQGYGTIAWGFLAVFVIPLMTLGLWKSLRSKGAMNDTQAVGG